MVEIFSNFKSKFYKHRAASSYGLWCMKHPAQSMTKMRSFEKKRKRWDSRFESFSLPPFVELLNVPSLIDIARSVTIVTLQMKTEDLVF